VLMPKKFTQEDVLDEMRKVISVTSLRKTAGRLGISPAYLSDVLNGRRDVSDNMAILFGFEREVLTQIFFRKKAA
jgi:DNA-binding transcriptional regulator YdaS (Cro superfamily)